MTPRDVSCCGTDIPVETFVHDDGTERFRWHCPTCRFSVQMRKPLLLQTYDLIDAGTPGLLPIPLKVLDVASQRGARR